MNTSSFQLQHACVLISGASSGLGAEFARQLAPQVDRLILVARREERLQRISESLKKKHPSLQIHLYVCDLSSAAVREELVTWIQEEELSLNLFINNAGLGDMGEFFTASWKRLDEIITLNIQALTHLSHLVLPLLRKQAPSALLHVGSAAGFFPLPETAVYAASKAYVGSFSEALHVEEKPHGVMVSLLCPGPSPTEFFDVASRQGTKYDVTSRAPSCLITSPECVVATALKGLVEHRSCIIPNRLLRLIITLLRCTPFGFFVKKRV